MAFRLSPLVLSLAIITLGAAPLAADGQTERGRAAARQRLNLRALEPGAFAVLRHEIPVDVVLIGFDETQVNTNDLRGWLPATYKPIVRYPRFYGLNGRDMGIEYSFRYSISHMRGPLADRFFAFLARSGREVPATPYQLAYNAQMKNLVDVTPTVLDIDAASVEEWLESRTRRTGAGYTVYFINWHGRKDFRFHYYTKQDDPDPDTRFNFGGTPERAITSWGGSTSRSWFYDFSAGPEWNTNNWVVDTSDLTGDGTEEYRMPPIWEYSPFGYRSPDALGSDMGLLTRFVAINLLFTPSPLYDPLVASPDLFGRRVVDTTILEDDPLSKGSNFFDLRVAESRWRRFQPYYDWRTTVRAVDPIDPGAKNALEIFTGVSDAPGCWVPFGTPFAQLFCYFSANLGQYVPEYRERDYIIPVFGFNTTTETLGSQLGLLGFSDDNWVDGTQTLTFAFDATIYRNGGYGFTGTIIHEVGHHIGMPHPHDGYDSEYGIDYGPDGALYFAWEGDESDTVMHYLALTNRFGAHNRDNMYRWETAGYLNQANALAGAIQSSEDADRVWFFLAAADALAARAKARFSNWQYLNAVEDARQAYDLLTTAATLIGASSETLSMSRMPLPPSRIRKYICRPRDLVEKLSGLK